MKSLNQRRLESLFTSIFQSTKNQTSKWKTTPPQEGPENRKARSYHEVIVALYSQNAEQYYSDKQYIQFTLNEYLKTPIYFHVRYFGSVFAYAPSSPITEYDLSVYLSLTISLRNLVSICRNDPRVTHRGRVIRFLRLSGHLGRLQYPMRRLSGNILVVRSA